MFMKISIADQHEVVINLGQDISQANSLITMFEQNAKFVSCGYNEISLVQPKITVELGEDITIKARGYSAEESLIIKGDSNAPVGFVVADSSAFFDIKSLKEAHAKALEKMRIELNQANANSETYKQRLQDCLDELEAVVAV